MEIPDYNNNLILKKTKNKCLQKYKLLLLFSIIIILIIVLILFIVNHSTENQE